MGPLDDGGQGRDRKARTGKQECVCLQYLLFADDLLDSWMALLGSYFMISLSAGQVCILSSDLRDRCRFWRADKGFSMGVVQWDASELVYVHD